MTRTTNGAKVDLPCRSAASAVAKLGVQRALGLPECATPPADVYVLAKRRGTEFVTITDHDTIAAVLEIAHAPDAFVSEELTAHCLAAGGLAAAREASWEAVLARLGEGWRIALARAADTGQVLAA